MTVSLDSGRATRYEKYSLGSVYFEDTWNGYQGTLYLVIVPTVSSSNVESS